MRRLLAVIALAAAGVVLGAAGPGDQTAGVLLLWGLGIALLVVLALPAALLLHTLRPDWIAAEGRALDGRKTACVVFGAAIFVVCFLLVAVTVNRHLPTGLLVTAAVLCWFVVGFAGCARREGEKLTGATTGVRPLVLGWLARSGAFAVPVIWPFLATYLVVTAFGVPLVTLLDRRRRPPTT